jgi:hypothetical protein
VSISTRYGGVRHIVLAQLSQEGGTVLSATSVIRQAEEIVRFEHESLVIDKLVELWCEKHEILSCATCKPSTPSRRYSSYQLQPESVVLYPALEAPNPQVVFSWNPCEISLERSAVPLDTTFLHVQSGPSVTDLEYALLYLPDLWMLEIVPSKRDKVSQPMLARFERAGIGVQFYRQAK